ncbi:hypothetical protein RZN22_03905 [Bacillaceae bacterium S4-13-58]
MNPTPKQRGYHPKQVNGTMVTKSVTQTGEIGTKNSRIVTQTKKTSPIQMD